MKKYFESMDRFIRIDGDNYGASIKSLVDVKNDFVVDFRINKHTNKLCIIQYYKDNKGYTIFISE